MPFEMWEKISGRKHDVYFGVCVVQKDQIYSIVVRTQVEFQTLSIADMESYWATGDHLARREPMLYRELLRAIFLVLKGAIRNVVGLAFCMKPYSYYRQLRH